MKKVKVTYRDNIYAYDKEVTLSQIVNGLKLKAEDALLGIVNGKLKELTYNIVKDSIIDFIGLRTTDGQKVYKRSLSFLFIKAVDELLKFLFYFQNIEEEADIPRISILAEFTGTSRIVN